MKNSLALRLFLSGALVWGTTVLCWIAFSYLFLVLLENYGVWGPVRALLTAVFGGTLALGAAIFGTVEWRQANLRIRRHEARRTQEA